MFLGADGKQVGMEMIECQLAVSSIAVKRSVDVYRRMWAGTAAQAAAVTMKSEVGDEN